MLYIKENENEKIINNIIELNYLLDKTKFIELNLNHFSIYALYDEKVIDNNTFTNEIIIDMNIENSKT